jgi:hypothetical protein
VYVGFSSVILKEKDSLCYYVGASFFFLVVLGLELQGLTIAMQAFYHLSHSARERFIMKEL